MFTFILFLTYACRLGFGWLLSGTWHCQPVHREGEAVILCLFKSYHHAESSHTRIRCLKNYVQPSSKPSSLRLIASTGCCDDVAALLFAGQYGIFVVSTFSGFQADDLYG